jgi:hypothetical protein
MAYRTPGEREDVLDRFQAKPWWYQHPAWYWVTLGVAAITGSSSPIINLATRPKGVSCEDGVTFVKTESWVQLLVECSDDKSMTIESSPHDDAVVLVRCTCRRAEAKP